jgi:hypothetical protein
MSLEPQNKTEAFFLKLREVIKPYEVYFHKNSSSGIEIFDLKNGIIIAREDGERFQKIYTIVKDLKPVKDKEEARKILKQITGKEPPKKLICEYSNTVRIDRVRIGYDSIPDKERIVTSRRGYPDIFSDYVSQPSKKQVEKSLDKFANNFGLRFSYKKKAIKTPKVTLTL